MTIVNLILAITVTALLLSGCQTGGSGMRHDTHAGAGGETGKGPMVQSGVRNH